MLNVIEETLAVFFFEETLTVIVPEFPLSTPSITSSSISIKTLELAGIDISPFIITPSSFIDLST